MGVSRKEILEATGVALAMGGGNVEWAARFVFKVLEDLDHRGKDSETNEAAHADAPQQG